VRNVTAATVLWAFLGSAALILLMVLGYACVSLIPD
jgi:hypothetical protein